MRAKVGTAAVALWAGTLLAGAAAAQGNATKFSWAVGAEGHYQRYEEPSLNVSEEGPFLGVTLEAQADIELWMLRADGRFAYGNMDYQGSGTIDDIDDLVAEGRFVIGRILPLGGDGDRITPYAGYGYRRLIDYLGGKVSTTGARGYDRLSQYHYVPIGLEGQFRVAPNWSIKPTIEYDYFIEGSQDSYLSQAVAGLADLHNSQNSGYGLRASLMGITTIGSRPVEFGPFVRYWNIDDSDVQPVNFQGVTVGGGFEPANETIEVGLALKVRF